MTALAKEEQRRICRVYLETNSEKETARVTGHSITTISKYLIRYGLGRGIGGNQDRQRKVTDEQILEAAGVMTRQEIADKYGVHVENLARRMKKLGVSAVYADNGNGKKFGECWHYVESHRKKCEAQHPCFEYIESRTLGSRRVRLRCRTCGCIVERAMSTFKQKSIKCEECESRRKMAESRSTLLNTLLAVRAVKTPKTCKACGGVFYSPYPAQIYCSEKCRQRKKRKANTIRRRCRKYGVFYDPQVTREAVVERDNCTCQICGRRCDPVDRRWGTIGPNFPTIDHIVALANGGTHTWSNVQCAHAICNSYKRDLIEYSETEAKQWAY